VKNGPLPFIAYLTQANALATEPFVLIDVGCSGGVHEAWSMFGKHFAAYAFDPMIHEIERLRQVTRPAANIAYFDAFVLSSPDAQPQAIHQVTSTQIFKRTSSARAMQIAGMDFGQEVFNSGGAIGLSAHRLSIDSFARDHRIDRIDWIKTDTDGGDFGVLRGARETLEHRGVLGVSVEVWLHGDTSPEAETFANIDEYLQGLGFSLFDLEVYRYTKGALPGKFTLDIPAQTADGQVLWGDAVYLRDLADAGYRERWPSFVPSPLSAIKLMALFELFGLNDCAMELLGQVERDAPVTIDTGRARAALATGLIGTAGSYEEHMQRYEAALRDRAASFPDGGPIVAEGYFTIDPANPADGFFYQRRP
jgi:FkbM family methyltransferase